MADVDVAVVVDFVVDFGFGSARLGVFLVLGLGVSWVVWEGVCRVEGVVEEGLGLLVAAVFVVLGVDLWPVARWVVDD